MNKLERILERLPDAKRNGTGWVTRCPAHEDRNPSLSIKEGDDGRVLVKCHAGCRADAVVTAVGLTMADLMPEKSQQPGPSSSGHKQRPKPKLFASCDKAIAQAKQQCKAPAEATPTHYEYSNREGDTVAVACRWDHEGEKWCRFIQSAEQGWIIGGKPENVPLHDLPVICDAEIVHLVEGEKFAEALKSVGLVATTAIAGSSCVGKADFSPLTGKAVVCWPDHDDAGEKWLKTCRAKLAALGEGTTARVVRPEADRAKGYDVADFIAGQRTAGRADEDIAARIESLVVELGRSLDLAHVPVAQIDEDSGPVANVISLRSIQPEEISWLWDQRIALGKLTLIAGDPGLGKSFVSLDIAARVSTGCNWPDLPGQQFKPGGVVLLSAEDGLADTIRPRLDAAEADVDRINALVSVEYPDQKTGRRRQEALSLERDLPMLEQAIQQTHDCRLVVIDPISAYCGKADSHNNTEVRGMLAPLSQLAERYGLAVLAVTHLNKSSTGPVVYRAMGTLAFVAAARAAWGVVKDKDKDDPARRLFLPVKNNIAPDVSGLAYKIGPIGLGRSAVVSWEANPVTMTADEAMAENAPKPGPAPEARNAAEEWLEELLADGRVKVGDVMQEAKDAGISRATLRCVKEALDVRSVKVAMGEGWAWELPEGAQHAPCPR